MPLQDAEVTALLRAWSDGRNEALDELLPLVFDDLRNMARSQLAREGAGHILQSTALVNEVFLRLLDRESLEWENRAQFFGFVGQQMRRILVDYARKRKSLKRGGPERPTSLDEAFHAARSRRVDLLALDDALDDLERVDSSLSLVVELKYFVGLRHQEIAEVLGISVMTVRRRWTNAKTWLYRQLKTPALG